MSMVATPRWSLFGLFLLVVVAASTKTVEALSVLVIGGTRFSGAYLWKELYDRGHDVTVFNRGRTPPQPVARESVPAFEARIAAATSLKGDRKNPEDLKSLIDPAKYTHVFDMNAREQSDTQPLAELFVGQPNFKQYVFMSSAGVYLRSDEMPHLERDPVDPKSRHKGKLMSEACLKDLSIPWCSFRPTYICGPLNYNPVERYFLERVDANRPICIPSHGQHLTGLGHVEDLAVAFANVIGREAVTTGKVYNVQNTQSITFDGVAKAAAKAMNKEAEIIHYNPKDISFPEGKKAFPMRPQHFFTCIERAKMDLDWSPKYDTVEAIMKDAYENDFVNVKAAGGLKNDFECDEMVVAKSQVLG